MGIDIIVVDIMALTHLVGIVGPRQGFRASVLAYFVGFSVIRSRFRKNLMKQRANVGG